MDFIELRKYHWTDRLVDEHITRPAFGNATMTKDGLLKTSRDFYEFFINEKPLSSILAEFCKLDKSILDNWIGVLGSFSNRQAELNIIKRLLLKQISEQEILDIFPKDLDKYYLDHGIEDYKNELVDEEIIIYGCAECGDYGCGGYKIKIDKEDDIIIWTFNNEGNVLQFHFDKLQYFKTFKTYSQLIYNRI